MLFAIIADDKPDGLDHRLAVRPAHLEHLRTLGEKLVFAGPFLDDDEKPKGSLMVIEAPSQQAAEALARQDPFVAQGVFARYEIRRWHWGINNPAGR